MSMIDFFKFAIYSATNYLGHNDKELLELKTSILLLYRLWLTACLGSDWEVNSITHEFCKCYEEVGISLIFGVFCPILLGLYPFRAVQAHAKMARNYEFYLPLEIL